ncbi:MAG: CBS domain-containing protein [Deltaproteobacteria bacterium]|nr:CBS domain-containing protein [Deltaproteobacteria bacterium]
MKEATVAEIMMKAPVTLSPDDTLDLANDIMSLGRIRHIPIVDNNLLVGVLSQRDLFGAAVGVVIGLKSKEQRDLLKSFRIREIMQTAVVTVSAGATVKEAAQLMAEKKIGCLPVLEGNNLVGLITLTNILRYVASTNEKTFAGPQ